MTTALVTGASSGIGYEFAKLFAADHIGLVLAARRVDRLNELAETLREQYHVRVDVIQIDLSQDDSSRSLYDQVNKLGLDIDYLVNNAGFGDYGLFHEREWSRTEDMMKLNSVALTQLTHLVVRDMVRRKSGRILNVASIAAFQPCPTTAVYAATKAYVLSFTEALHNELRGSGVTATALCPGPTRSGFQEAADMEGSALFRGAGVMSSSQVAAIGYRAMMRGKAVVIPGLLNKVLSQSYRFSPRFATAAVSRFLMRRKTGHREAHQVASPA